MDLFTGLVDDAAMFPPGNADPVDAVRDHRGFRETWFGWMLGPLVVPDTALTEVARRVPEGESVQVSVVNTGGAGGLLGLSRRELPGVGVVAVESALRDLDDLAGNARRVVAAAEELAPEVAVFVEIPYAPGWVDAVGEVEAAGRLGKIRTGGVTPELYPDAERLAEQLSVLVEADLAFKATAGLHRAWPNVTVNEQGDALHQHGFLTLLMALDALVDGADVAAAAALLRTDDRDRISSAVGGWDDGTRQRVRRRFRSFGCCGVTDPITDLVALGLVTEPVGPETP